MQYSSKFNFKEVLLYRVYLNFLVRQDDKSSGSIYYVVGIEL